MRNFAFDEGWQVRKKYNNSKYLDFSSVVARNLLWQERTSCVTNHQTRPASGSQVLSNAGKISAKGQHMKKVLVLSVLIPALLSPTLCLSGDDSLSPSPRYGRTPICSIRPAERPMSPPGGRSLPSIVCLTRSCGLNLPI